MRRFLPILILLVALVFSMPAFAGFTETLPQGTFLLDLSYIQSDLNSMWNDDGERVPLIEPMERYEPGAGSQGTMKPMARAIMKIFATQLYYGITDSLILGVGIPVIISTIVEPNLEWESGDYQWGLGRPYSESDFWEWAGSMGQPKPQYWEGNQGELGDIQFGLRYRFTDNQRWFVRNDVAMSFLLTAALPTGKQPNPEDVISAGTTSWDLHTNGDIGFHLSLDKNFSKEADDRVTLGFDIYYEFLFDHEYESPAGEINPLMLNYRPYIGDTYTINGGDFSGGQFQIDIVPVKGPALGTWLVKGDAGAAALLPPLWTISARYTFTHLQQTDWESDSAIWDYDREKLWQPGYKNIITLQTVISLLRVGLPIQPYFTYRNLTWLPGKNSRAPNAYMAGTRILLKFW
jgi:hypothetical protein